jgi:Tol biopolymer transport system component
VTEPVREAPRQAHLTPGASQRTYNPRVTLPPGTPLGPYVVDALLGEGGMGTVYRARDTRLDRQIALKFVLDAFVADRDRTARFAQEARTLAALNHPNIATIHGLEQVDGRHLLVMEFVDGETLADRIARHPSGLPLDEALEIAAQIASGLEAAHDRGIVHRDLKPANIRITPAGTVKVLDFGLAKAIAGPAGGSSVDVVNSPTLTAAATEMGVVLGTAAYMAPEQARGKAVDKRADIWAFGVVLFEMLTGRRLFAGASASDIIAAVLTREPNFDSLPHATPASVRHVLRRCLERDPRRRLRDIGDARLELDEPSPAGSSSAAAPVVSTSRGSRVVPVALAAALVISLAGWAALWSGRAPAAALAPIHYDVRPVPGTSLVLSSRPAVAVSRDGSRLAFVAAQEGESHLFLRDRADVALRRIPGTLDASAPAFSPDGQWIAFVTTSHLTKVTVDGRTRVELSAVMDPRGLAWLDDQSLVVAPDVGSGLHLVPASGGAPREITTIDRAKGERSHRWPAAVPGGRAVLFTVGSEASPDDYNDASIDAVAIATGERTRVLEAASTVQCTEDGRLLFMRRGVLYTVRFDSERLAISGAPAAVLPDVEGDATTGAGHFSLSAEHTLVYVPGLAASGQRRLAWADETGQQTTIDIPPNEFNEPAISPDGARLAVVLGTIGRADVWIYDIERKVFSRLTFEGRAASPAWSADGASIYYAAIDPATLESQILRKAVDGSDTAVPLATLPGRVYLGHMDPRERFAIVMQIARGASSDSDIVRVPLTGGGEPQKLVATSAIEYAPAVSPDGRWLAYVSTSSGVQEVWVRELEGTGQWQVSTSGGIGPRWSPDGRKLYFRKDTVQMVAPVETGPGFRAGTPHQLFAGVFNWRTEAGMNYAIDPTTGRFLMILPPSAPSGDAVTAIRVIAHWR